MMQVWLLFKIIQGILGSTGMIYHVLGFSYNPDEPLPHLMICCGTFFGFTIVSIIGIIKILVGGTAPVLVECILNYIAALLYVLISMISMHFAEVDFHLMYLSDFEEPVHPYFLFSRSQSIVALAAGAVHLLHAILATDVLVSRKYNEHFERDSEMAASTVNLKAPWRMYFLSKYVEDKLRRFTYFDKLCRRETPKLSMFSFSRKSAIMARIVQKPDSKLSSGKSFFKEPIPKKEPMKNKFKLFKRNSDYEFEEVLKVSKFHRGKQEKSLSIASDSSVVSEGSSVSALRFMEADEVSDKSHLRTSKELKKEKPISILRSGTPLTIKISDEPPKILEGYERPEEKPAVKPKENREEKPNENPEEKPEGNPEEKPNENPEEKPEGNPEEKPEEKSEEKKERGKEEQKGENTEPKSKSEDSETTLSSEESDDKKSLEKKANLRSKKK